MIEWNVVSPLCRTTFLIVDNVAADSERGGIEMYCKIYCVARLLWDFAIGHHKGSVDAVF